MHLFTPVSWFFSKCILFLKKVYRLLQKDNTMRNIFGHKWLTVFARSTSQTCLFILFVLISLLKRIYAFWLRFWLHSYFTNWFAREPILYASASVAPCGQWTAPITSVYVNLNKENLKDIFERDLIIKGFTVGSNFISLSKHLKAACFILNTGGWVGSVQGLGCWWPWLAGHLVSAV